MARNDEVIRQWRLLRHLAAGKTNTINKLAEDLEVTTRTIRQVLADLQSALDKFEAALTPQMKTFLDRPYGASGFGFGRVSGKVTVEGDDVTNLLDSLGYLDRDDLSFTKALFEVGGGVAVSKGRLYADVSYRFRKFLQTGEPINVSGIYAGVGVGF